MAYTLYTSQVTINIFLPFPAFILCSVEIPNPVQCLALTRISQNAMYHPISPKSRECPFPQSVPLPNVLQYLILLNTQPGLSNILLDRLR